MDSILIVGAGPIGLGVLSILRFLGLQVMVSEPSAYRRDLCATAGAIVFDPVTTDLVSATNDLTAGLGPTVVFDCVGRPATQTLSLDIARPKGKVCFIGENKELTINPSRQIIHKELTLIGSVYFTLPEFQRSSRSIGRDTARIPLRRTITRSNKLTLLIEHSRLGILER